jgi:hypothetical protein
VVSRANGTRTPSPARSARKPGSPSRPGGCWGSEHLGKAGLLGADNGAFAGLLTDGAVTAVVVYDPTRILTNDLGRGPTW